MRKTIDNPVARVVLVTAIGTCMVLAGSSLAEAKGAPQRGDPVVELISPGAGYGSPHGSTRVRTIQHLLRRAGERPGPVDGRFGPLTEAAVERFQAREGLAVDGIVGRVTAPALRRAATLITPGTGYGSPHGSTRVRTVQRQLRRAGERPGLVDGRFGPLTEAAVERFQAREGLAVDGIVGDATKGKLARLSVLSSRPSHPRAAGKAAAPRADGTRPESIPKRPGHGLPAWLFGVAAAGVLVLVGTLILTRRLARPTRDKRAAEFPPFQVSIHGRGGRGVLTAAELLSVAALVEGRNAVAFPSLGSGQAGPHVVALCRIGGTSIRPHEPIRPADGLIVEDPQLLLLTGRFNWLRPEGYLLINSTRSIEELGLRRVAARLRTERSLTLPASELARGHLGVPAPDTALVGGFVALSGVVSLTSVVGSIRERFPGASGDANVAVAEAAFDYVLHELERLASPREEVEAQKHPA
jgi:pyruvate ferredoxin oxidoreductase gamma subunit